MMAFRTQQKLLKCLVWIEKEFMNGMKGLMLKPMKREKERKLHQGGAIFSAAKDSEVFSFLDQKRGEGRVVTTRDLTQKAMEVAESLALEGFVASKMWLQHWKKRWNVGYRRDTNYFHRVPEDYKVQLTHYRRPIVSLSLK